MCSKPADVIASWKRSRSLLASYARPVWGWANTRSSSVLYAHQEWRHDEDLGMKVLADDRPFVETGSGGAIETLTEVRAEQDDFDRLDEIERRAWIPRQGAGTRATTSRRHLLGIETRQLPGGRDDLTQEQRLLGTETAIGGEADDFARGDRGLIEAGGWRDTKTSIRGEADDFATEHPMECTMPKTPSAADQPCC